MTSPARVCSRAQVGMQREQIGGLHRAPAAMPDAAARQEPLKLPEIVNRRSRPGRRHQMTVRVPMTGSAPAGAVTGSAGALYVEADYARRRANRGV